jgi:hypothetical protein
LEEKKHVFLTSSYANFQCGRYNISEKKIKTFFAPQNIKKPASKVAHNPTRPRLLTPASIWLCGT